MADNYLELYKQIREDAPDVGINLCGRQYSTRKIFPVDDPTPFSLSVNTLTGIVDYLKDNVDQLSLGSLICHVESPRTVSVYSSLHGDFKQRSAYIRANLDTDEFPFEDFLDAEKFNIKLQASFIDTPVTIDGELRATDKGLMLRYVGNIADSAVRTTGDDGVSQNVTVKTGVVTLTDAVLPNPVVLRPFRTFHEVEQPASSFIFRAKEGPRFALFEADNGSWRGEAMKSIKAFFEFEVQGLHVIA